MRQQWMFTFLLITIATIFVVPGTYQPGPPPATATQHNQSTLKPETSFANRLPENTIISPDGRYIIGIENMRVGVWRSDTREFLGLLTETYSPSEDQSFRFSPDGRFVWSEGKHFYLWDIHKLETILTFTYRIDPVFTRYFVSEYAHYFAFWQCVRISHLCRPSAFSIFDTQTGELSVSVDDNFSMFVDTVEFNEDEQIVIAAGCLRRQILGGMFHGDCMAEGEMTWDLRTGELILEER